jgi:hypothetical protein
MGVVSDMKNTDQDNGPHKPHAAAKESTKPRRLEDVEITPEAENRFRAAVHAAKKR